MSNFTRAKNQNDINIPEAIRGSMHVARDLKLISENRLNLMFGKMIESMDFDDFEELSSAMKRLSSILTQEGQSRQPKR